MTPSPDHRPPLSVIVPVLNAEATLRRTLDSLLSQQDVTLDILVMDGGSQDSTPRILEAYAPHLHFWKSAPDGGQAQAINEGFRKARPGIWTWLNADDTYVQADTLAWVAGQFAKHPDTQWLYASALFTEPAGNQADNPPPLYRARPLARGWRALTYWHGWPIPQPAAFFTSGLWEKTGGLSEKLHYAMDYDLFLRMNRLAPPRVFPDVVLAQYLRHAASKTGPLGEWHERRRPFFRECARVNRSLAPWWAHLPLTLSYLKWRLFSPDHDAATAL